MEPRICKDCKYYVYGDQYSQSYCSHPTQYAEKFHPEKGKYRSFIGFTIMQKNRDGFCADFSEIYRDNRTFFQVIKDLFMR